MDLVHCSCQGLIPGPLETNQAFSQRVDMSQIARMGEHTGSCLSQSWEEALTLLEKKLGVHPVHLQAVYSKEGLNPWEGAATWIERSVDQIYQAKIQLHPRFKKRGKYYFHGETEVLAHEAVHAMRLSFPDSRFEELIPLSIFSSRWKMLLGSLLRFRWVLPVLVGVSVVPVGITCAQIAGVISLPLVLAETLPFWSSVCWCVLLVRGLWDLRHLCRARRALARLFPRVQKPDAILWRLSQEEIIRLSRGRMTLKGLAAKRAHLDRLRGHSLRWQQIFAHFSV